MTSRRCKPKLDVLAGPVANDGGGLSWVLRLRGTSYPAKAYLCRSIEGADPSFGLALAVRELGRLKAPYKCYATDSGEVGCTCKGFSITGRCKHAWAATRLLEVTPVSAIL